MHQKCSDTKFCGNGDFWSYSRLLVAVKIARESWDILVSDLTSIKWFTYCKYLSDFLKCIVRKVRLKQLSFTFWAFSAFSSKTSFSLSVSDKMNTYALSDGTITSNRGLLELLPKQHTCQTKRMRSLCHLHSRKWRFWRKGRKCFKREGKLP